MQGTILLNHDAQVKRVEEEEKNRFLYSLLEQMDVPVQEFWNGEEVLSVDQKIKLKNLLNIYNIKLIDDNDGHLDIYFENQKIGEWNKCTYKLKKDMQEIDPKKKLFLEMQVNCWTMFENMET